MPKINTSECWEDRFRDEFQHLRDQRHIYRTIWEVKAFILQELQAQRDEIVGLIVDHLNALEEKGYEPQSIVEALTNKFALDALIKEKK